jgi:O-antigen ligase
LRVRHFVPVVIGGWAAAAGTAPPATGAVLAGLPAAAAIFWWTIGAANRWLAVFFTCALLLPPVQAPWGGSFHIAPLAAGLGVLAGILRAREWQAVCGALPFVLVAFLAVLAASVAFAGLYSGPAVAGGTLARVLLFAMGIYAFLYAYAGPGAGEAAFPMARYLLWVGMASAAFACLDFYFQFAAPAGSSAQFVWLSDRVLRRAQGVFYEASTLGNLCVFFLVLIAVAAFEPEGGRIGRRGILAAGGGIFGAALVFSYSRGSVVNLAMALAALFYLRRVSIWKSAAILLGCVAMGAMALHFAFPTVAGSYWSRLSGSVEYMAISPNGVLSGRLTTWQTLLEFLARAPWNAIFGIGYKTLPYTDLAGEQIIGDNTYLSLLVETGVTGLAVFLAMNGVILRTAWRAAHSPRAQTAFFGKWIFCFWCGEAVQMLSGDLITYWRVLPVYLWVLATAAREP